MSRDLIPNTSKDPFIDQIRCRILVRYVECRGIGERPALTVQRSLSGRAPPVSSAHADRCGRRAGVGNNRCTACRIGQNRGSRTLLVCRKQGRRRYPARQGMIQNRIILMIRFLKQIRFHLQMLAHACQQCSQMLPQTLGRLPFINNRSLEGSFPYQRVDGRIQMMGDG